MNGQNLTFIVVTQNILGLAVAFQITRTLVIGILHLNLVISSLAVLTWIKRTKPPSPTPDQLYQLGYQLYAAGYGSLILDLVCTMTAFLFGIFFWDTVPRNGRISACLSLFLYAFIPIIITSFRNVEDRFLEIFFERGRIIILESDKLPIFLQKRKGTDFNQEHTDIALTDPESSKITGINALIVSSEVTESKVMNNTTFEDFLAKYFGRLFQLYQNRTVQLSLWRLELDFVKKCVADPQIRAKIDRL
ncbi:MAG: hypothetical protein ACFFCQ_07485 [Promethearchaeota archaeon]